MKKENKTDRSRVQKYTALCLLLALLISMLTVCAAAEGNIQYPSGVTEAMCHAEYWAQKAADPDKVMMSPQEIDGYNALAAATQGTYVLDLEKLAVNYDASSLKKALISSVNSSNPTRDLYVDGEMLNKSAYFGALSKAVDDTAWTGSRQILYGVCVGQTDLMSIPSDDVIGYSKTDADSEFQSSALNLNDPVVIKQFCSYEGKAFYYVESDHCSGWVNTLSVAVCANRAQWLEAWKTTGEDKDILVVTQNRIITEPSIFVPETANVKLTLGTTLKLVPADRIADSYGERFPWNSYVVYLPTRDSNGSYVRREALISQHYSVSVGFLPMTQANIMQVAFSCLGDRYGWGGMLDAMDCSMFNRNVYRCFGLRMPRNTTWQQLVPGTRIDIGDLSDTIKMEILKNTPAGAMLYFPGHTMIYTGYENDTPYVISALGSAADSEGELSVKSVYSVALNPMSVRRRNGNTWLSEITSIVIPANSAGQKYDPTAGIIDITPKDACPLCGKIHYGFWGKIVQALHKAAYFILHLFGISLSKAVTPAA